MASHAGWIAALAGGVAAAALAWSAARAPGPSLFGDASDPALWPGERATLTRLSPRFSASLGVPRVVLDPGHGAPHNRGNTSSFCVDEQDAMMEIAEAVRDRLEATGAFEVRLTREPGALVDYGDRIFDAEAWAADAFVSLHSDVRGKIDRWSPEPGKSCPISLEAPGFAVLYSDESDEPLTARRLALGRAVSRRLLEAGFLPYGGADYTGIYAADSAARGLFVDRHTPDQRIFLLRRTGVPAVLIETHNALDPREATRWRAPETLDAFSAALAAALADALAR